jgi:hypothetical protein
MIDALNLPRPSADQVAAKLAEYHRHRENGDTDLAQKAWREYWDMVGDDMLKRLTGRNAA